MPLINKLWALTNFIGFFIGIIYPCVLLGEIKFGISLVAMITVIAILGITIYHLISTSNLGPHGRSIFFQILNGIINPRPRNRPRHVPGLGNGNGDGNGDGVVDEDGNVFIDLRNQIDRLVVNPWNVIDELLPNGVVGANVFIQNVGPQQNRPRNDRQNVHDSSVQSHIVQATNKLSDWYQQIELEQRISADDSCQQILDYILQHYNGATQTKMRAIEGVNLIQRNDAMIQRLNLTELNILQMIWQRINSDINTNIVQTLKENLVLNLADCMQNNGLSYCVTGRVARIISTLEQADAEGIVNLKPLWAIKEEISSFYSKYREKFLAKLPKTMHDAYEEVEPTDKQERIAEYLKNRMISGIESRLRKRYVETKLVNTDTLNQIIQENNEGL